MQPASAACRSAERQLQLLGRVAIVHDYLNQRGGAERVALELSNIWPGAPIYTSLYRRDSTFPEFADRDIRATFLDRLPVDQSFRNLFALYPAGFRQLGEIDAEVVIASSSGWAHMARPAAHALHVVYCHTPARWLYGREHLLGPDARRSRRAVVQSALPLFRKLDRAAARRANLYIANSEHVRARIRRAYGIDAAVVPPPVDVNRFRPTPRGERLLVVSRLLPYKHVDLVVRAATRTGIGLDVVGEGPHAAAVREAAGPNVELHGAVDDRVLVELLQNCRAVCIAAEEDFGLVAVEAQAAGKPVIAYGCGGALETVKEDVTGVFFRERTVEAVIQAIAASERLTSAPEQIAEVAREFSPAAFRVKLAQAIENAREETRARPLESSRPQRKLRVVYLDHVAQPSGGELALLRLLRANREVEAHVILAEDGPLVKRLQEAGISVEVLPMPARTRRLRKGSVSPGRLPLAAVLDTARYVMKVARRVRRLRPDVVHTNSLKAGVYGSVAARLAGVPVVWHLRDRLEPDYLPMPAVLMIRALIRRLPHVVVANSETTRQTLRRHRHALVIPSVIEPITPERAPVRRSAQGLVVGMVGRLSPWKGQHVFLRAFAAAFPSGDQRAVIIGAPLFGDDEREYAHGLHELANELGIAERVEFRGHRERVQEELQGLDVLVHASTTAEPFGQVVVEGMAAGLPVVASRSGGPEEVITDGVDGLLYPPRDVDALAAILVRLGDEEQTRHELGQAASTRARDFSPALVTPQVMRAYELARREVTASSTS